MSADWPLHSLSDFINIKHGFAFKGEFFQSDETSDYLVTPGNFAIGGGFKADKFKYYNGPVPKDYILEKGDLVVTMTDLSKQADTLGYSALIPAISKHRLLHNQRVGLVEINSEEIDKTYLYFLLHSREYRNHILGGVTGTTVKHTFPKKILSYEFKKPPFEIQVQIGKKLIALENKIELNRQTNQTLEQIAQAMFKSWFVDFEPTRAKIAAKEADQDPERAAMAAISGKPIEALDQLTQEQQQQLKTTAALFPDSLIDSELGEIPDEWINKDIRDLGGIITGKTPPKKIDNSYADEGVPFITPTDVDDSMFVTVTNRFLTKKGQTSVKKVNIKAGSICVTCIGSQMGKAIISPCDAYTNQQINTIEVNEPYYRNFLVLNLRNRREEIFDIGSGGSTMPIINKTTFGKLNICIPKVELLKIFDSLTEHQMQKILAASNENISLANIRDSILPELLSGELSTEIKKS